MNQNFKKLLKSAFFSPQQKVRSRALNALIIVCIGAFFSLLFDSTKSVKIKPNVPVAETHPDQQYQGLAQVTDGDSIKVEGNNTRLVGIDAPELKQECFNAKKEKYACGVVSKEFLFNLAHNKKVVCYYSGKDVYQRFLSECFIEGEEISINEKIIANGMAVVYSFSSHNQKLEDLEQKAKINKIGIWQGAFQLPKDYRKQHRRK